MTSSTRYGTRTRHDGSASPRQIAFLWELSRERVVPEDALQRLQEALAQHELGAQKMAFSKADASIKWFLRQPVKAGKVPSHIQAMPTPNEATGREIPPEPKPTLQQVKLQRYSTPAEVGVYRVNSDIYIVVASTKNPDRRYAKKLVLSPPRMTENGEEVDFSYERAPGMVWLLGPTDKMPVSDMRDFMIKYRKCIRCGHGLKAAKTLKRSEELGVMVGKTCARKMNLIP